MEVHIPRRILTVARRQQIREPESYEECGQHECAAVGRPTHVSVRGWITLRDGCGHPQHFGALQVQQIC